jgi:hypothetical protein
LPNPQLRGRIEILSAEDLWWVMQHSDDPEKRALAVTCYCDDGGSEDHAVALIGGLVMNRDRFLRLDKRWQAMLHEHRIQSVHMNDFVRPNGRHVGMHHEMKLALFTSVARLIRSSRVYSIVMGVPLKDFRALVPAELSTGLMRPHSMAYFMVVVQNNAIAEFEYKDRLAYLVDHGSFEDQLLDANHWVAEWELRQVLQHPHVGSITFDFDERVTALQAADVIVWSSNRHLGGRLTEEFAPLNRIYEPHFDVHKRMIQRHLERIIPREGIAAFANQMNSFVNQKGRLPSVLSETLSVPIGPMPKPGGKRKRSNRSR